MHNLLNAPCLFCGYSGEGYYQAGTHAKDCPWHSVGGDSERYGKLPGVITALFKERQNTSTNSAMVPCLKWHNDGGKCVVLFAGEKCGDTPCLLTRHQ